MEAPGGSFRSELEPRDLISGAREGRPKLDLVGWCQVECYGAVCSIPDLGLESEEVVISVDAPASDGSRRLLLQSLARPDLGLTVLRLQGTQLVGGDETWMPEAEPIIEARWCLAPRAPSGSPRRRRPEPDAEPAPSEELLGFGVVGGSELLDTETNSCMVLPTGEESKVTGGQPRILGCQPRRISRDGIGRSAGALLKEPLKAGYTAQEPLERPDEATKGLEQDPERLVAAAVLGKVADVQQLLGHVRLDGLVESGRYAQLTALMAAAARGRTEVVRELIERKAGLDVKDPEGWTVPRLLSAAPSHLGLDARHSWPEAGGLQDAARRQGAVPGLGLRL